jgi:hypothetical protein
MSSLINYASEITTMYWFMVQCLNRGIKKMSEELSYIASSTNYDKHTARI